MSQSRRELINQSIDYILQNITENLTVKNVADHFHYSEYYFGRIFKDETGETVYAFMKRLKMDQSAIDMKLKYDESITNIGLYYGYSPSNYSSAFKKHHAASPAQFRKSANVGSVVNPFCPARVDVFEAFGFYNDKIRIDEMEQIRVLYRRLIGNYSDIKDAWIKMLDDYKSYIHASTWMLEKFYDDPSIASNSGCICDLCLSADEDCELENVAVIKGGKFAIYRFEGNISDIFRAVQGVFSIWLPRSGYEMSERYGLNIYRKTDFEHNLVVMDLCIPIR
ncbi:AraC family transcriptional regulator [Anaerolentibacter hominis]|uniref:AraC family transcriptional regulator n=1 Tax=Anaerolentibacter hominis TaxID=3079009 RepID=UPI0031B870D1